MRELLSDVGCRRRVRRPGVVVAVVAALVCGCGSDDNHQSTEAPPLAVVSAFPAELAPNVERATIREKMVIDGHVFRVGVIEGVPVVLVMTGIGLMNAANTTRLLLDHFEVSGVVVSAVAGSMQLPIGDVAVPVGWTSRDATVYAADPGWLDLAREIAASGDVALEHCTMVPSKSPDPVCLPGDLAVVVGGIGQSRDPFGTNPFPCQPNGGDLLGCDIEPIPVASPTSVSGSSARAIEPAATDQPTVEDMETAAIANEAAAHNLPFIAFRAVSDGPGDPLNLGDFLAQFSAYYPLAARNASAATAAFLKKIAATR